MGVTGLTSYVNDHRDLFFQNYRLQDTTLIIDGNALGSVLFKTEAHLSCVFGGNYDTFLAYVQKCFSHIAKCNIRPIVVFDGVLERKKLKTCVGRKDACVKTLERITPSTSPGSQVCLPLFVRQTFRDALTEINITMVQSDSEADPEIAALAKALNCPLLSNDSDFYIFDALYIPLSSVDFTPRLDEATNKYYIACERYDLDAFLAHHNLSKIMLPLLSTIAGNDYVKRYEFSNFYSNVSMPKGRRISNCLLRIRSLLSWLRHESFSSAVNKILAQTKSRRRPTILKHIKEVVKSYYNSASALLEHIPPELRLEGQTDCISHYLEPAMRFLNEFNLENLGRSPNYSKETSRDSDDDDLIVFSDIFPTWFIDLSRRCVVDSVCPTIRTLHCYLVSPQVEEYTLPAAHAISFPIMRVLIALFGDEKLDIFARKRNYYCKEVLEPLRELPNYGRVPTLEDLTDLPRDSCLQILLEASEVQLDEITAFPDEWRIFFIGVIYWLKKSPHLRPYHIHSVLLMVLIIKVISPKIHHIRNKGPFFNKFGSKLDKLRKEKPEPVEMNTLVEALTVLGEDDAILIFERIHPYLHFDETYRHRSFDRVLVHSYSQLQSCIMAVHNVNVVLKSPLPSCIMGKFYNGMLLYNLSMDLSRRSCVMEYLKLFFEKTPSLMKLYELMYSALEPLLLVTVEKNPNSKRKRKHGSKSDHKSK